ncbi:MAG: O-antigen ligase family protein [Rhodothermales bacterium]
MIGQELVIGLVAIGAAGGAILYGGEEGLAALYLVALTIGGGLIAYRFPTSTLMAWAVLSLYWRQLMDAVDIAGGIDARPTDPILLAMAVALVYAFMQGDRRTQYVFTGPCIMWVAFFAWVGLQVGMSSPRYGLVSALGEFRLSFQPLLVLPFIVAFVRTKEQQRRLFIGLVWLSVVFVSVAIVNGLFFHDGTGSKGTRWMVAHVNLALALVIGAWYTARRTGFWTGASNAYGVLLLAGLALIVFCAHRSVWAATVTIIFCLSVFGLISAKDCFKLAGGLLLAAFTIDILAADLNLIDFVRERMTAFTSYTEDATASWRAQVWAAAIEQVKANPVSGKGLGNYFYFQLDDTRVVTTIPHNVYVQLSLQVGLVGLCLYLAMVGHMFQVLRRAYRRAGDIHSLSLTMYGMIALLGGSVFYFAYGFEPFTWLFVGAGMAAALTQSTSFPRD